MPGMTLGVTTPISNGSEVPIEAVWAGVAVVVVAAIIAAVAGYLRTRLMMRAERERLSIRLAAEQRRLEAQLKAESERQLEALAHDRAMRDTDEIRIRLDEVIDMGEAALSAVCSAREAHVAGDPGGATDQLAQARECLGQCGYKERRLRLRMGVQNEVMQALVKYRESVQALHNLVRAANENNAVIPLQDWNNSMAEVAAAQVGVIQVGVEKVGARIA